MILTPRKLDIDVKEIGSKQELEVIEVGQSEQAFAVKVQGYKSNNTIHHITVGVSPSGAPKDSNTIPVWEPVDESKRLKLTGYVEEIGSISIPKPAKQTAAKKEGQKGKGK